MCPNASRVLQGDVVLANTDHIFSLEGSNCASALALSINSPFQDLIYPFQPCKGVNHIINDFLYLDDSHRLWLTVITLIDSRLNYSVHVSLVRREKTVSVTQSSLRGLFSKDPLCSVMDGHGAGSKGVWPAGHLAEVLKTELVVCVGGGVVMQMPLKGWHHHQ